MLEVTNKIGRRKTSVARVYVTPGKGEMLVNDRDFKEYFPNNILQIVVMQPFAVSQIANQYDVKVNVDGGGSRGQAEAIRMAVARALCEINAELRAKLKKEGFLTRDSRMVERKKYGRKKARRRFQFSKR